MFAEAGLFKVGYSGVERANHLDFCRASDMDVNQSTALIESIDPDLQENVLKVDTERNMYVAGIESANRIFAQKYEAGVRAFRYALGNTFAGAARGPAPMPANTYAPALRMAA